MVSEFDASVALFTLGSDAETLSLDSIIGISDDASGKSNGAARISFAATASELCTPFVPSIFNATDFEGTSGVSVIARSENRSSRLESSCFEFLQSLN